jgi:hypothetical protein
VNPISANNIQWTVPKEWHIRKVLAELKEIITPGALIRIILVSVALAVGIWFWAERTLGPLEFNWFRALALSVGYGIGVLLVGASLTFFPQKIYISAKGIDVRGLESVRRHKFDDIEVISIEGSFPAVLTFRKRTRDYRFAIAESVDLEQLRQQIEHLSGRSVQMMQTAGNINAPYEKDSF